MNTTMIHEPLLRRLRNTNPNLPKSVLIREDNQQPCRYQLCLHLVDFFLYSFEVEFIQGLQKKDNKKPALSFNFTFQYIDDALSLNKFKIGDSVDRT